LPKSHFLFGGAVHRKKMHEHWMKRRTKHGKLYL
jgi:hypothetical protein